ncbi:MAG: exopolysaccharide biosynthesis protein [Alphaproteobacteria bacterium]|nr:exopolysaccharide biosynthesis protein [Alphaproteobacteria bacterium]
METPPHTRPNHVPTSVILKALLLDAPADFVSLDWLIGALRERSFGLVMLLMGLVALVPGGSTFMGFLLAYPALQLILGRDSPSLPRFIAARRISTERLSRVTLRAATAMQRLELVVRPRWHTLFRATKRIVGVAVLALAPTLIWPFPFSHIIPAFVVMLLSLAYLEEDGALLCVSLFAALASLAITGLSVWAGIRATDLLGSLFGGT